MEVTFDTSSPNWNPDPEYCRYFLQAQQNYFNQKLHACGFVMLNEVLEALGFPRTTEGCIAGWTILKDDEVHIDFGLDDDTDYIAAELKLNHQGIIFGYIDMINKAYAPKVS